MQLKFMWKDDASNTGNCPAVYEADGGYVVQGKILGLSATAVYCPANVIDRLGLDVAGMRAIEPVRGGYIVHGQLIDAGARAQLRDLDDDETAVFVPVTVVRMAGVPA